MFTGFSLITNWEKVESTISRTTHLLSYERYIVIHPDQRFHLLMPLLPAIRISRLAHPLPDPLAATALGPAPEKHFVIGRPG